MAMIQASAEKQGSGAKSRRYVPDLRGFMDDCDANYLRFLRLLPDLASLEEWMFGVETPSASLSRVRLRVIERSRYTTTVMMVQEFDYPEWLPNPVITVRLYHDARMAEVLSYQRSSKIHQNYPYPNVTMHLPDEKAQVNGLLGEWLTSCISRGCALNLPAF